MSHKIAKLILEHADSITDRKTAIQKALELGMGLEDIHEYLDWLDNAPAKENEVAGQKQIDAQ